MNVGGARKNQGLSVMSQSTAASDLADEGFASVLQQVANGMGAMLAYRGSCLLNIDQPPEIFRLVVAVCQDLMDEEHTRLDELDAARAEMVRSAVPSGSGSAGARRRSPEASARRLVVRAIVHESEDDVLGDSFSRVRAQAGPSPDIRDRVRKDAYVRQLARCLGLKVLCKVLEIEPGVEAAATVPSEEYETRL